MFSDNFIKISNFFCFSSIRVIPHTNLLLVLLTNASENTNKKKAMSTDPVRIKTNGFDTPVCYKVSAVLSRRRPSSCSKNTKEVNGKNQNLRQYEGYFKSFASLALSPQKINKCTSNQKHFILHVITYFLT